MFILTRYHRQKMRRSAPTRQSTAVPSTVAVPIRMVWRNGILVMCFLIAVGLILASPAQQNSGQSLRMQWFRALSPVYTVLNLPQRWSVELQQYFRSLDGLRQENAKLKSENAQLQAWQTSALRWQAENKAFRQLLHAPQEPSLNFITSRVLVDLRSPYTQSVLVEAQPGTTLRIGMAALAGESLIGRVVETTAEGTMARVLLLTDPSARIPVLAQQSRLRAILAGDVNGQLSLENAPVDQGFQIGDHLVTAGDDGVFPAGLPVGQILSQRDRIINVAAYGDLRRLEFVRLVDYGQGAVLRQIAAQDGHLIAPSPSTIPVKSNLALKIDKNPTKFPARTQ